MFTPPTFDILVTYTIIMLISFPVHELAHAYVADYFGDMTPRNQGRLSLNPLKHLDLFGSLLLITAGFGWARPVMVNPMVLAQASPNANMLVALAGPASNLVLAFLGAIPFWFGLQIEPGVNNFLPSLGFVAFVFVRINVLLFFFNMIPLAPLDGEKIFGHFLPPAAQDFLVRIRPYSMFILIGLAIFGVFGLIVGVPTNFVVNLLLP